MYISFSGAQGSGKSTLANMLYEKLNSNNQVIPFTHRVGKFCSITRKLLVELDVDLYELRKSVEGLKVWQYFALKEHFEQLGKLASKYDIVIMDRCYIDFLIYTEMFIGDEYAKKLSSIFKDEIDKFEMNAIKFYLEPLNNVDSINDGVRDTSCYDNEVKLFEAKKDMFDFVIPSANIDERINMIIKYLNI